MKNYQKTKISLIYLLKNIFSVISKVDFNSIEENDKVIETIQNIIKNTIKKHFEEETILILQNLNTKTNSFSSYKDIFYILELITNCPILVNFCNLYKEHKILPAKDYEYEIKQKEKEIEILKHEIKYKKLQKHEISNKFAPISEQFKYSESDIFKACKEGKLTSVQRLLEQGKEDKNKKVEKSNYDLKFYEGDTPIHVASQNGHLLIVKYLIEKQNVDKNIKGNCQRTPLHYACSNGHLLIVKYFIENQNVDKDIKGYANKTPLHYACENGHIEIVKYLISKYANVEARDKWKETPLHFASNEGKIEVVKYLVSIGARKYAKTESGKTPYDLAKNDEIRKILK